MKEKRLHFKLLLGKNKEKDDLSQVKFKLVHYVSMDRQTRHNGQVFPSRLLNKELLDFPTRKSKRLLYSPTSLLEARMEKIFSFHFHLPFLTLLSFPHLGRIERKLASL